MNSKYKKAPFFILAIVLAGCINDGNNTQVQKSGKPIGPVQKYVLVKDWPQLPAGYKLGNPTGIGIDKDQNIIVFHRAGRSWPLISPMPQSFISAATIIELDRESGIMKNSWGGGLFIMPHGLKVDKDNNIWVTDVGLHQVFKFSHAGVLLMKIGEAGGAGKDAVHFNRPTDVAVARDGSFYVCDGYGNSRVVKFSSSGQYLLEWGVKGDGPGQFNIPHGIDLDDEGNVYVADRENSRVQVFDPEGKYVKEWKQESFGKINAITFDKEKKQFLAVDYQNAWFKPKGSDILLFDSTGNILFRLGRSGSYVGPVCWYHDIAIDNEGSVYIGDILGNRIWKFKRVSP